MAKTLKSLVKPEVKSNEVTTEKGSMASLENQFLIAMPSLGDPYFNKSVTYICEHNEEGAMGLIINLPVNITLADLLNQIKLNDKEEATPTENEFLNTADDESDKKHSLEQLVLSGGPLAQQRGFVLHTIQDGWDSSLALSDEVMITTSKDILMALGTDKAPENFIVALGYAGWDAGQLEQELKDNSWLTIPADNELLFKTPIDQRWKKAAESLGVNLAHLSSDIGHA